MYNTLKCVETLGNVPSLIFKTLGQLENVTEPFRRSVYYAFTSPISFHSTSLEILSPSLHFKQAHVLPAYFTSEKIKANYQYEHSPWKQREWCCIWHPYGLPEFVLCFGYLNLLGTPGIWQHVYYHLKKKKRIFKKFYFYLWLSLRKGNGFYKQMLEIIIVLLQLYTRVPHP